MTKSNKENTFILISVVTIILLGGIIYANSLKGQFIWDDHILVRDNIYIQNLHYLPNIFTEDIGSGSGFHYYFYRPLLMLSYAVDFAIWKFNTFGYHLTNTIIHILVAVNVYFLIILLFGDKPLALLTSLFFISHPTHVEAVAYISGRGELLSAFSILLFFIIYLKFLNKEKITYFILLFFLYLSALLSKENSLILPLLLLAYHIAFNKKPNLKIFLLVALLCLGYIFLRLRISTLTMPYALWLSSSASRIPGFFVAITKYFSILILPLCLYLDYGNLLFSFTDLRAIGGIILTLVLLLFTYKKKGDNPLISFYIFWFFIALLPYSNIFPPLMFFMADHHLYLSSIGYFLILSKVLINIYRTKKVRILSLVFTAALLTFYSYLTVKQNIYWREPIAFYERTLKYSSNSVRSYHNLGKEYGDMGDYDDAIKYFKKAIELTPNSSKTYLNLAATYIEMGRYDKAIESLNKVLAIKPDSAEFFIILWVIKIRLSKILIKP